MNCYKCATPLPDHSRFCMACGADVSGEGHTHQTINMEPDPELLAALQAELGSEFTVERELGRGGMAIVYLGQDTHLGRKVAIKLLPPMLTFGAGPGFIERFKREARTAATLDHPHIIPVYRVSTGGKLFWYVMKYLPGESLDVQLKRDGPMTVERTIEVLMQSGDALDFAHQNNVVHRDVKPANIMIDKRGRVTVTDFGIAKALDTSGLTGSGATIGTPHYMSPEQCNGIGVSGASDQYSLAVTAYQMLSGHVPFSSDSILELMRMHLMDPPPPLATLRPQLGPAIVAAVERGLAKTTAERFPTCMDFARELARAAQETEVQARRPKTAAKPEHSATIPVAALVQRPVATVKEVPRRPQPHEKTVLEVPSPTGAGRSRVWFVAGGITLAAAIGIAVIVSNNDPPVAPDPAAGTRAGIVADAGTKAAPESTTAPRAESTKVAAETTKTAASPVLPQPPANVVAKQAGTQTKRPVPDASRSTKAAPPPVGVSKITVGSRPISAITINGRPAPSNPVLNFDVPSGRVVIRFQVTDSTGVWTVDTTFTVAPGETRNLGRVLLKRP